jgi:hypothetical protein
MSVSEVFTFIVDGGPLTARQLSAMAGVSVVTINKIVARLSELRLVEFTRVRGRATGPAARHYSVPPAALRVAVAAYRPGRLTAMCTDPVHPDTPPSSIPFTETPVTTDALLNAIGQAARRTGVPSATLRQAMVSVPADAGHPPDWRRRTERELRARLGCPVDVRPDHEFAALAEAQFGAARDTDNFVLITGGPRVAITHVVDRVPQRGAHGFAGSLELLIDRLVTPSHRATAGPSTGPDESLATGTAAACMILDPSLVVLSSDLIDRPGSALTARVTEALQNLVPDPPRVTTSAVDGDPVLRGARYAAHDRARAALLDRAAARVHRDMW